MQKTDCFLCDILKLGYCFSFPICGQKVMHEAFLTAELTDVQTVTTPWECLKFRQRLRAPHTFVNLSLMFQLREFQRFNRSFACLKHEPKIIYSEQIIKDQGIMFYVNDLGQLHRDCSFITSLKSIYQLSNCIHCGIFIITYNGCSSHKRQYKATSCLPTYYDTLIIPKIHVLNFHVFLQTLDVAFAIKFS